MLQATQENVRIKITKADGFEFLPDWFTEGLIDLVVTAKCSSSELEPGSPIFCVPTAHVIEAMKLSGNLKSFSAHRRWLADVSLNLPTEFIFNNEECCELSEPS